MRAKEDHGRERQLRKDQTEAEALLWSRLRNRRLENFKFRRQHRIGSYFADFVCSEHRLIIELMAASMSIRPDTTKPGRDSSKRRAIAYSVSGIAISRSG